MSNMRTYQIPVWFTVQAETKEQSWYKLARLLEDYLPVDLYNHNVDEYVIEEPVDVTPDEEEN